MKTRFVDRLADGVLIVCLVVLVGLCVAWERVTIWLGFSSAEGEASRRGYTAEEEYEREDWTT